MSQHDDHLELLISKSLDGELSPSEQHELNEQLKTNQDARILFDQWQNVHSRCQNAIEYSLAKAGGNPLSIIQEAQEQAAHTLAQPPFWHRLVKSQFAAGLAAGLMFATLMLAVLERHPEKPDPNPIATLQPGDINRPSDLHSRPIPSITVGTNSQGRQERRTDLYIYTDEYGNHWLMEGQREDTVQPYIMEQDF